MPNSACSFGRHCAPPIFSDVGDDQHVRTIRVEFEPFGNILTQDRRRERPKALSIFNLEVQIALHGRGPRIAKDRAGAKRAWPELQATLEPTDRLLSRKSVGRLFHQGVFTGN